MTCECCGANRVEKLENGVVVFDCGGHLHNNGVMSCGCRVGPSNKDNVMRVYWELRGEEIDNNDFEKFLNKILRLEGRKHTELNKDGSVGAWHRRTNPRPKPKSWKL